MAQTNVEVLKRDPEDVQPDRKLLEGEARSTAPGPAMCAPDGGAPGTTAQSNGPMPRKRWTGAGRR